MCSYSALRGLNAAASKNQRLSVCLYNYRVVRACLSMCLPIRLCCGVCLCVSMCVCRDSAVCDVGACGLRSAALSILLHGWSLVLCVAVGVRVWPWYSLTALSYWYTLTYVRRASNHAYGQGWRCGNEAVTTARLCSLPQGSCELAMPVL